MNMKNEAKTTCNADIRAVKSALRAQYRARRKDMNAEEKRRMDTAIFERVIDLEQYRRCKIVLAYASTADEIDTWALISAALRDGKTVALPRCVPGSRKMEFYRIDSLSELTQGSYGILEPPPDSERLIDNIASDGMKNTLCIVPAFCYDSEGYRLGYGGGYYDRFLQGYCGGAAGVAYSSCVVSQIPHGRFDCNVSLIVSEKFVRIIEPMA